MKLQYGKSYETFKFNRWVNSSSYTSFILPVCSYESFLMKREIVAFKNEFKYTIIRYSKGIFFRKKKFMRI